MNADDGASPLALISNKCASENFALDRINLFPIELAQCTIIQPLPSFIHAENPPGVGCDCG